MAADRITGKAFATRSEVIAREGMAATSQPLATIIALDILKGGGSAVDAAIGANAALGLMEPTGCGIGGDLFAIVWDSASQRLHGLNASGRSPQSLTIDEFRRRGISMIPQSGPLPVSTPGAVDGWFMLHERFGRMPMSAVLAPAIGYAEKGFPVSQVIADAWAASIPVFGRYPGFLDTFTVDGRRAPREGEIFRNPDLARTYRGIADDGRDYFYRGEVARIIDEYMAAHDGFLSAADLAAHRSNWIDPVSTDYRGYTLWELPPNGQGIAALQMLNILEGWDFGNRIGFGSGDHLHLFVEAKKRVFEDRARFYADPEFNDLPIDRLISKAYGAERRQGIDPARAASGVRAGDALLEEGDTIYLTVADRDRNMVSLIQSNYRGMGSGMCPPGLGFGLQNRGEMFTLETGHFNAYEPGKRPFHTIIPAFVTRDGKPWLSYGVMGGATQPQAHVQVLMNLVDFGMNLQEAGDAPRVVHSGSSEPTGESMDGSGWVSLENGFSCEAIRELETRGHRVRFDRGAYGGYQAILYDAENDTYRGASESRKDGMAAGY